MAGERPADEELVHLACALVQSHDPGIPHILPDWVLVNVPVAAEDLQ